MLSLTLNVSWVEKYTNTIWSIVITQSMVKYGLGLIYQTKKNVLMAHVKITKD